MAVKGYRNFDKVVCMLVLSCLAGCVGARKQNSLRKITCPWREVKNGFYFDRDKIYETRDEAHIQCESGYRLVGNARLRCGHDGRWLDNHPLCQEIRCERLPGIANGKVVPHGPVSPRESVEFTCNEGFQLYGPAYNNCTDEGTWEQDLMPFCLERRCGKLPNLANGKIVPHRSVSPGESVYFRCNEWFELYGSSNNTCTATGIWEQEEMPVCIVHKEKTVAAYMDKFKQWADSYDRWCNCANPYLKECDKYSELPKNWTC